MDAEIDKKFVTEYFKKIKDLLWEAAEDLNQITALNNAASVAGACDMALTATEKAMNRMNVILIVARDSMDSAQEQARRQKMKERSKNEKTP